MTARDEAITKAAEAIANSWSIPLSAVDPHVTNDARLALAAAVPVLLNDLADRAEKLRREMCEDGWMGHNTDPDHCSTCDRFVALVRAAAEGWGA